MPELTTSVVRRLTTRQQMDKILILQRSRGLRRCSRTLTQLEKTITLGAPSLRLSAFCQLDDAALGWSLHMHEPPEWNAWRKQVKDRARNKLNNSDFPESDFRKIKNKKTRTEVRVLAAMPRGTQALVRQLFKFVAHRHINKARTRIVLRDVIPSLKLIGRRHKNRRALVQNILRTDCKLQVLHARVCEVNVIQGLCRHKVTLTVNLTEAGLVPTRIVLCQRCNPRTLSPTHCERVFPTQHDATGISAQDWITVCIYDGTDFTRELSAWSRFVKFRHVSAGERNVQRPHSELLTEVSADIKSLDCERTRITSQLYDRIDVAARAKGDLVRIRRVTTTESRHNLLRALSGDDVCHLDSEVVHREADVCHRRENHTNRALSRFLRVADA